MTTSWRTPGTAAAVCLTVDDVHPTCEDPARPIGETARRALQHLKWLLDRHPTLKATLFCTPDWRLRPSDPGHGDRLSSCDGTGARARGPVPAHGTARLDRHPDFVAYLRGLPRVEFALHGLFHRRRGQARLTEFEGRTEAQCRRLLQAAMQVTRNAGLPTVAGLTPPNWVAPDALLRAMANLGMDFVASARDLDTAVSPDARSMGSGMTGVSLIYPQRLPYGDVVHFTTNFQATSAISRALDILDHGGLVAIKAHIFKQFGPYVALDGLDLIYAEFLHRLLSTIEDRHGTQVWWTTMGEIARHWRTVRAGEVA